MRRAELNIEHNIPLLTTTILHGDVYKKPSFVFLRPHSTKQVKVMHSLKHETIIFVSLEIKTTQKISAQANHL